jgi:hypothetical protein
LHWPEVEALITPELNKVFDGSQTARAAGDAIDQKVNAQLAQWGQLAS